MSIRTGWSLEKDYWGSLSRLSQKYGLIWRQLKYSKPSLIKMPEKPGLYMLCSKVPDKGLRDHDMNNLMTPLYIGRTWQIGGLRARVGDHISRPQESIQDVYKLTSDLYVLYSVCDCDHSVIEEIEDSLIVTFGPPANRMRAKVIPIRAKFGKHEKVKVFED